MSDVGAFDHLLVLRSWNHLHDPSRALSAMARALRAGGTLTIVDNVAFGLVRDRAQAERAEAGGAEFEHYRNDDAQAADALVGTFGFSRIERADVATTTSNQWLLRYRKSA